MSPISYVGFAAIAAEIILEYVDASGLLTQITRGVSVLVLIALIFLLGFKRAEYGERRRQKVFLSSAHLAVTTLDQLSLDISKPEEGLQTLTHCVDSLLQIILETFSWRGSLNANVMLPEDENLVIKFVRVQPGIEYDKEFKPRIGDGGAGLCFQEKAIVYFPRTKWKHGVQIKLPTASGGSLDLTVCVDLYKQLEARYEAQYSSILCVPIAAYHQCFGVLNLDSKYSNPFSESDYLAVAFFGGVIALALTRYQAVYMSTSGTRSLLTTSKRVTTVTGAAPERKREMLTAQAASEKKLVLQPAYMTQASLLVPEDQVSDPRAFFQGVSEMSLSKTRLTLGTIWRLFRAGWSGKELPNKLPL